MKGCLVGTLVIILMFCIAMCCGFMGFMAGQDAKELELKGSTTEYNYGYEQPQRPTNFSNSEWAE